MTKDFTRASRWAAIHDAARGIARAILGAQTVARYEAGLAATAAAPALRPLAEAALGALEIGDTVGTEKFPLVVVPPEIPITTAGAALQAVPEADIRPSLVQALWAASVQNLQLETRFGSQAQILIPTRDPAADDPEGEAIAARVEGERYRRDFLHLNSAWAERRFHIEPRPGGHELLVCDGFHQKHEPCHPERWVHEGEVAGLQATLARLIEAAGPFLEFAAAIPAGAALTDTIATRDPVTLWVAHFDQLRAAVEQARKDHPTDPAP